MAQTFYRATAADLHTRFINNLNELKETSSSFWRKEIIKELNDIQSQAKQLHDMNVLHPLDAAKLKHILGRDLKEFIYLSRHGKPESTHGTNYTQNYGLAGLPPKPPSRDLGASM